MAKKKEPVDPNARVADLMDHFLAASEKKGFTTYGAGEHVKKHVGVPLPALSFEYLLGSRILYLGSFYGLAGPPQSFKSALAIELARIILAHGGLGFRTDTEGGKISGVLIQQILGHLEPRLRMSTQTSVEEAQKTINFQLEWWRKECAEKDQLLVEVLDSLNGPSSDDRHKVMVKEGYASRQFPVEALLWSQWLKDTAPRQASWPLVFLFVNHEKKPIEDGQSYRHPGGDAQDFYSTVYMHVRRTGTNDGAEKAINSIMIRTVKNSFAMPGRKIMVPFVQDKVQKRLYFDWGHSTADFLTQDHIRPAVKDILEVTTSNASMTALTRTFSCKKFHMSEVTGEELGNRIHGDATLMHELREHLAIEENLIWSGTMYVNPPTAAAAEPAEPPPEGKEGLDLG